MSLREKIRIDVEVRNKEAVSNLTSQLTKASQAADKAAQGQYRLQQGVGRIAASEQKRQRELEQGQFRLQTAARKIAAQQEQAEAKRAAAHTKQAAREEALRARTEAAEAKRHAREEAARQRTLASEQSIRSKQVAIIERNAIRGAVAVEKAAERERRAMSSIQSEMVRLDKIQEKRGMTAIARQRLGLAPLKGDSDFLRGHGFTNRSRQMLGVARDLSVAGWGIYGAARMGASAVSGVFDPFRELQSNLAEVKNKGGKDYTPEEMAAIGAMTKNLGRTTQYSATQASSAAVELAAAGLTPEALRTALPSTLKFSQASGLDSEQSSGLLVESMSQFGLGASDFSRIGDVMVTTANKSTISVADLGESLKYVGPIAAAAGQSIESTSAAIGFLGERGIKASQAGTALRSIFANLAKPAKQAKDALQVLGIGEKDLQKGLSDLPAFFESLAKKMDAKNISKEGRLKILKQLFGNEGMTAAVTLMGGTVAWREFEAGVRSSTGAMETAADVAGNTLNGKLAKLHATTEAAKLELAEKFAPMLTDTVIPGLTSAALATGDWISKHEELTKLLGGAAAVGGTAWAASLIPGVVPLAGWIAGSMSSALASGSVTAALTTSAGMLAGSLMSLFGAGIAGYALGTYFAKALAGVESDEDLMTKIQDIVFGKRTDRAGGRGMGGQKTVPDAIAENAASPAELLEGQPDSLGPLSVEELERRANEAKGKGIIDFNGAIRLDVRYGKIPRVEEINFDGPTPLRVAVQVAP